MRVIHHSTTHCIFQSKLWSVPCWVRVIHHSTTHCISELKYACTHTRHISDFFWNWQNRRCVLTPDLRLFKSNTARDEGISANRQTQHWRTINIWLAVTSSHALFLRRIKESSQSSIILLTMAVTITSIQTINRYGLKVHWLNLSPHTLYTDLRVPSSNICLH